MSDSLSPQIDATLMTSANNTVANLSFQHEATPPFALTGYSMQAADATNPLGLIQDSYSVTRDITGEIGQINSSAQGNLLAATYDPAARLTKLVAALNHRSLTTTLVYDSFGRKRGAVSSTGLIGSFSYDLLNRFTSIYWNGSDGAQNQNFAENIGYEALTGNISQITRENSVGTFNFTYDNLNQLVTAGFVGVANLPSNIVNRSFQYDPTGNRVSDSLNGQGAFLSNQITADARFTFVSDSDGMGNLVKKINNQTLASEVMSYRADGKMTNYQSSLLSAQYYFDALGRRIAKKIAPNAQASYTQSYSYIGAQDKILIAKAGDGTQTLYVDGQGVNEHFGEVGSRAKAYVTDHLESVINGAASGSAQSFGAHGEMLSNAPTISSTSNPIVYGWQGLKHDSESGLEDNWHRTYDSVTGRFLQLDPIGFEAGDTNLYRSRRNNPLMYADPSGKFWNIIIGAAAGGISAYISGQSGWDAARTVAISTAAGALSATGLGGIVGGGLIGSGANVATQLANGASLANIDKVSVAISGIAGAAGTALGVGASRLFALQGKVIGTELTNGLTTSATSFESAMQRSEAAISAGFGGTAGALIDTFGQKAWGGTCP